MEPPRTHLVEFEIFIRLFRENISLKFFRSVEVSRPSISILVLNPILSKILSKLFAAVSRNIVSSSKSKDLVKEFGFFDLFTSEPSQA